MSSTPNNSLDTQSHPPTEGPPTQNGGCGRRVWIILALFSLLILVICCGVGFWLYKFIDGTMSELYRSQLESNPVIVEHVGEDISISMDVAGTTKAQQETNDNKLIAFTLEGSKGTATVIIKPDPSGAAGAIESAELVLPDNTRIDVPIGQVIVGDEEIDLDEFDDVLQDLENSIP
ncbi:MAG: cytochrome c oxidase assembly factor 1 family protein [Pirellulales bacterium]|nr:cytochrome c oxidase assembly factor 1 family protein [Pirellulales bacterium]